MKKTNGEVLDGRLCSMYRGYSKKVGELKARETDGRCLLDDAFCGETGR